MLDLTPLTGGGGGCGSYLLERFYHALFLIVEGPRALSLPDAPLYLSRNQIYLRYSVGKLETNKMLSKCQRNTNNSPKLVQQFKSLQHNITVQVSSTQYGLLTIAFT